MAKCHSKILSCEGRRSLCQMRIVRWKSTGAGGARRGWGGGGKALPPALPPSTPCRCPAESPLFPVIASNALRSASAMQTDATCGPANSVGKLHTMRQCMGSAPAVCASQPGSSC